MIDCKRQKVKTHIFICDDVLRSIYSYINMEELLPIRLTSKNFDRVFTSYVLINLLKFPQKIKIFRWILNKNFVTCANCKAMGDKELFEGPCFCCGNYYCFMCLIGDDVEEPVCHTICNKKNYCNNYMNCDKLIFRCLLCVNCKWDSKGACSEECSQERSKRICINK